MLNGSTVRPIAGVEDAFGVRAVALRTLQRELATLYLDTAYQEVIPPLVERPQSLARGSGRFLSEQTIVFSDPAGAGQLALRPDITPQVARLAATRLHHAEVLRLHYSGPVLLARAEGESGARQQWQSGIELFGVGDLSGDIEVLYLAAQSMRRGGFSAPVLLVGHIGLLRALLGEGVELAPWVALLRRRSPEDVAAQIAADGIASSAAEVLLAMVRGEVDSDFLQAHCTLNTEFSRAVDDLVQLQQGVEARGVKDGAHGCRIVIDGALMPRFLYHSGILFAGYAAGVAYPLLHGGRYDAMVAAHGRDMAATGFSCDLWSWIDAGKDGR
ncbi:MAG: ATP phosphoribosyltransferase regulatory subunit [Mariprofundales bacterium]|nr:ATP phosphoribosyltransferase regulatory subunit [Mariprofundales bacterium]